MMDCSRSRNMKGGIPLPPSGFFTIKELSWICFISCKNKTKNKKPSLSDTSIIFCLIEMLGDAFGKHCK